MKPHGSLSIDLDNAWSYLKTRNDEAWQGFPSYLDQVVPDVLSMMDRHALSLTVFIVGRDAALPGNRAAMGLLGASRHEMGNHSYEHEPWITGRSAAEIAAEIGLAQDAISGATGRRPSGFRSPGYALAPTVLEALGSLGFLYDASSLPTCIGPIARAYYFATAKMTPQEREQRKALFGSVRDAFRPLKPYMVDTGSGSLLELPVTTFPGVRLPIHFSYVLYLAERSELAAMTYFRTAMKACRAGGVQPSLLLHPLDFLVADDVPSLAFFPAMHMARDRKRRVLDAALKAFAAQFEIVGTGEHARRAIEKLTRGTTIAA
jgi:hypothetical protein